MGFEPNKNTEISSNNATIGYTESESIDVDIENSSESISAKTLSSSSLFDNPDHKEYTMKNNIEEDYSACEPYGDKNADHNIHNIGDISKNNDESKNDDQSDYIERAKDMGKRFGDFFMRTTKNAVRKCKEFNESETGIALKEKAREIGRTVKDKSVEAGKIVAEKSKETGSFVKEKSKVGAIKSALFMRDKLDEFLAKNSVEQNEKEQEQDVPVSNADFENIDKQEADGFTKSTESSVASLECETKTYDNLKTEKTEHIT